MNNRYHLLSPMKDDILETALTSGINFAAKKYGVTYDEVYRIVKTFKDECTVPCSCEIFNSRGKGTMMCLHCDRKQRILIRTNTR